MTTDVRRGRPQSQSDSEQPRAARRPAKPPAGWVFGAALAVFFAALALLAFQVRAGRDPALGPAQPVAQVQTKPRRVVIRRVIERVVVHHPPTAAEPPGEAAATSAPTTTSPAPAPASPAPAPAPAPLTTQSS